MSARARPSTSPPCPSPRARPARTREDEGAGARRASCWPSSSCSRAMWANPTAVARRRALGVGHGARSLELEGPIARPSRKQSMFAWISQGAPFAAASARWRTSFRPQPPTRSRATTAPEEKAHPLRSRGQGRGEVRGCRVGRTEGGGEGAGRAPGVGAGTGIRCMFGTGACVGHGVGRGGCGAGSGVVSGLGQIGTCSAAPWGARKGAAWARTLRGQQGRRQERRRGRAGEGWAAPRPRHPVLCAARRPRETPT